MKRYRMNFNGYQAGEVEDSKGEWIRYEDHQTAVIEAIWPIMNVLIRKPKTCGEWLASYELLTAVWDALTIQYNQKVEK